MIDNYLKILNATETILEHLDDIKDAFITFYGEESREFIENKFKHFNIITFIPDTVLPNIMLHIKEELSFKTIKKILDSLEIHYEENSLNFKEYEKAFKDEGYSQFLEMYELQENGRKLNGITEKQYENIKIDAANYLREIWQVEVSSNNIEELQSAGKFDYIEKCFKAYKKYLIELEQENNLSKYIEEVKQNYERKNKLKEEYKLKLIEEFLPEELEKYKKNGDYNKIKIIIGSDFADASNVLYFSNEVDKKLLNDKKYKKDFIKTKRIEYFKSLGIDLGEDYENYEYSEECKKLIPNKEYIDRLIQRKTEYVIQFKEKYYGQMIEYKENEKKVKDFNLVCEDNGFSTDTYTKYNNSCYIRPNAKIENGALVENPIMFINVGFDINTLDKAIIHEINHILELSLIKETDSHLEFTCGWNHVKLKFAKEEKSNLVNKKEFEIFCETINEMIAQRITKILHDKNHYIFTEKGHEIYDDTIYQEFAFIVTDFLDEYLDDIIISRRNNNINHIFEVVGKENFMKLNNLISEFIEKRRSNELLYLSKILLDEPCNPDYQKPLYIEINRKKDEILQSMREYSKRNVQNL